MIAQIKAGMSALWAFAKAYDADGGKSPSGFPHIDGWNRSENPYDRLFASGRNIEVKKPLGALVFAKGMEKGRVVYLDEGTYTVGSGCSNDIVIGCTSRFESLCSITVCPAEVRVIAKHGEEPLMVNSNQLESGDLIDQDLCEVGGIAFFYMGLEGDLCS